jgi:hypothetical protein
MKKCARSASIVSLAALAGVAAGCCRPRPLAPGEGPLPPPELAFKGSEGATTPEGRELVRYRIAVTNSMSFPAELFEVAPNLAPCGRNDRSSRTWVEILVTDRPGRPAKRRVYGFCALRAPRDLETLWFAAPKDAPLPCGVAVELQDRRLCRRYRSATLPLDCRRR